MNLNEIKKSLECCCIEHKCGQCSYNIKSALCINNIMSDALAYINQLEDEVEKLNDEIKGFDEFLVKTDCSIKEIQSEAIKEFAERVNNEISDAILSNGRVIEERKKKYNVNRYEDDLCIMCASKIMALGGIKYFINSLVQETVGENNEQN